MGNGARDCIEDELVIRELDCMYAAQMLRKDYMKETKGQHFDQPAGCYYLAMSDDVHFNTILDPSGTNNLLFSSKGVCVGSMYCRYYVLSQKEYNFWIIKHLNLSHVSVILNL